jgi:hypothetical protein
MKLHRRAHTALARPARLATVAVVLIAVSTVAGAAARFKQDFQRFFVRLRSLRVASASLPLRVVLFNLYNPLPALLSDAAQRAESDELIAGLNAALKRALPRS